MTKRHAFRIPRAARRVLDKNERFLITKLWQIDCLGCRLNIRNTVNGPQTLYLRAQ